MAKLPITHTSTIFNKRNNLTLTDPNTPVSGIWSIIMEDSITNIRNCNIKNNNTGGVIASNSNVIIVGSNIEGKPSKKTIPVVGIKNSKIYWDSPTQAESNPYLITTQDSFANFPKLDSNTGPRELSSFTGLSAIMYDGTSVLLNTLKGYPRLLNDGSTFFWDNTNLIYPSNILRYEVNITNIKDLEYLQKNLHRRELIINVDSTTTSAIIEGFYNGKITVNISKNCTINNLSFINLDQVEIYGAGLITNSENSGAILSFDNVKYINIHDIKINVKQTTLNYDGISLYNYKYNLYEYYTNNMWKTCIEIKNSNATIENCTFTDCYCPVIGVCNAMIYGEKNSFIYTENIKINDILFRPVCYLSTHNSMINDITSTGSVNNHISTLKDMTLNDDQRDKTTTFIPGIAAPGAFFNHSHKELIATIYDTFTPSNLEDYPPIGAMFATIKNPEYNFPSGINIASANKSYGLHYTTSDHKIKVRNYGEYKTTTYADERNNDIDELETLSRNAIKGINSPNQKIVPTISNIPDKSEPSAWINRTFENSSLFDVLRFNFNMNDMLTEIAFEPSSAVESDLIFSTPSAFYNGFLSNVDLAIKDCSYNYIYKNEVYNLITPDQTIFVATPNIVRGD